MKKLVMLLLLLSMSLGPSLNAYAQDESVENAISEVERGPNNEYIFSEDSFLVIWREYLRLVSVEEIYEEYVVNERQIALKLIELDQNALELLEESEQKVVRLETKLASRYSVGEVVLFTSGGMVVGVLIGVVLYAVLPSS